MMKSLLERKANIGYGIDLIAQRRLQFACPIKLLNIQYAVRAILFNFKSDQEARIYKSTRHATTKSSNW